MVDFSNYVAPGVYTESVPGPQLAVASGAPTAIGLFGMSVGFRTATETITIAQDTSGSVAGANLALSHTGVDGSSVVVSSPASGQIYQLATDYILVALSSGPDGVANTSDDLSTIERVIGGHINEGDVVQVAYNFTDTQYFLAQTFFDFNSLRDYYGQPFDISGNILSPVTLCAKLAFQNGASQIVVAAVNPATPGSPVLQDYQNALEQLDDIPAISVIISTSGMQTVESIVLADVKAQSNILYERRAILGLDGTGTAIPAASRITAAQGLNSARVALVSPATFTYVDPQTPNQGTIIIGGQYMAAAVAGLCVSNKPSVPLTRKVVQGFADITEKVVDAQKSLESQSGLMVIEKTRSNAIRVRHGVSSAPTTLLTREWSITGQQDAMIFALRAYLDGDGLIGSIINDLTLANVKASADAALQSLVASSIINNYANLAIRQLLVTPDVLEIQFDWLPALPLNYISIRYSINLTSGTTSQATTS